MVEKVNNINNTDIGDLIKNKLTVTQKLVKLKTKILDNDHGEHITIHDFNKLWSDTFSASLRQVSLASKNDIADMFKNTEFD